MDASISLPSDPKSIEWFNEEEWFNAIQKEAQIFRDRKIFRKAPQHGRAMKSKIVLRYMFKNDFTIKFKARLVACGYIQLTLHTTNLRSADPNPNNESLLPTTGALRFMAERARPDI